MSEQAQSLAALRFPDAPVEVHKGWNEMVHRYFAGALGLVILALAVQALRRHSQPGQPVKLPLLLLAVVITQAAFGMWTVTLQLWPQVVTAHLLGGFTTLSLLFLLTLRLSGRHPTARPIPAQVSALAMLGLLAVAVTFAILMLEHAPTHTQLSFTRFDQPGDRRGGKIEDRDLMPGFEQVAGHGPAHVAESEKTDMHGRFLFLIGGVLAAPRPTVTTPAAVISG